LKQKTRVIKQPMTEELYTSYVAVIRDQYACAKVQQDIMNENFNLSGKPAEVRSDAFGKRANHLALARRLSMECQIDGNLQAELEEFLKDEKVKR